MTKPSPEEVNGIGLGNNAQQRGSVINGNRGGISVYSQPSLSEAENSAL
jgi:hypothetical protein